MGRVASVSWAGSPSVAVRHKERTVRPPIVGYALSHTWVVMLTVAVVSGSVGLVFVVGVCVYPFFHLGVKFWHAWRGR